MENTGCSKKKKLFKLYYAIPQFLLEVGERTKKEIYIYIYREKKLSNEERKEGEYLW